MKNLTLLIAISLASGGLSLFIGQDASWDLKNYHYYSGYAFLNKELNYDFAPAQIQSFFNPLIHVPTYLLIRYLPGAIGVFLLGAMQGMNCWLLYLISLRVFDRLPKGLRHFLAASNTAVGFYGAANMSELGTTFADNIVSIPILASLLFIFKFYSTEPVVIGRCILRFVAIGLILGITLGLKLNVVIYIIPISGALLITALLRRLDLRNVGALYMGMLVGFCLSYGYWGLSLFMEYQNPVFPYFNNIFRSEYYLLENPVDPRFMPRNIIQAFLYPFHFSNNGTMVCEVDFSDARLAICYAVLALVVLSLLIGLVIQWFRRKAPCPSRSSRINNASLIFFAVFFISSYVLWQYMFSIYRYAMVLEFLAPLFISTLILWCFGVRWFALAFVLIIQISIGRSVIPINFERAPFGTNRIDCELPAIPNLESSVVVLTGQDALAYVIPSFPPTTRFVRIEANFLVRGTTPKLEQRIRRVLMEYSSDERLGLLADLSNISESESALARYGLVIDADSCRPLTSDSIFHGYICHLRSLEAVQREVHLEASPLVSVAGRDTLKLRVINLNAPAIDVQYSIDGQDMPPVDNWLLDDEFSVSVFVDESTRRGCYQLCGIRDARFNGAWIPVDLQVIVR